MFISRAETIHVKGPHQTEIQNQCGHSEERDRHTLDTRDSNDMETINLEDTDTKTGEESKKIA